MEFYGHRQMGFQNAFTMKFLVVLIVGLTPGQLYVNMVIADIDLSYYDLEKINGTCSPRDTCSQTRNRDSPGITTDYSCSCSPFCSIVDTCCIDSYYRNISSPALKPSCRLLEGSSKAVFMVDRCPGGYEHNSALKHLCEEDWNGDDNVMMLAPVTSLVSVMTYKNYFCFRCHESTEYFVFWDLQLLNRDEKVNGYHDFRVTYDPRRKWLAITENGSISLPIKLKFIVPSDIEFLGFDCKLNVISSCSDTWADEDVRDKCSAYTAIIYFENGYTVYKNPHCAVCNFKSLDDMKCQVYMAQDYGLKKFSFSHLIDVSQSEGDKVGKLKKCRRNSVWDPYSKRCRKTSCAIPSYVIRNNRCSPP